MRERPREPVCVLVRFFAAHRDCVGGPETTVTLASGTTVAALWEQLVATYPCLAGHSRHVRSAVNEQFCPPERELQDGDEVAYIPPVSGGNADVFCVVSEEPPDTAQLVAWARTPHDGAVVTFAGVVRDNTDGRPNTGLLYEAYTGMAVQQLEQIGSEARARWPIGCVAVHHCVGHRGVGETALVVVVAAPHRQPAFDAAAYIIDRIKEDVPIWKHEQV